MPQNKPASQSLLLLALILGCLMLCVPAAALKGQVYITVVDSLGGTLKLKIPSTLKSSADPDTGLLIFATDESLLDLNNIEAVEAGGWAGATAALPRRVVQGLVPAGEKATPRFVVDSLKSQMSDSIDDTAFEETEDIQFGEAAAARVTGTSVQGDVLIIVIEQGDVYLLTTAVTAPGERSGIEPLIRSILESAQYSRQLSQ